MPSCELEDGSDTPMKTSPTNTSPCLPVPCHIPSHFALETTESISPSSILINDHSAEPESITKLTCIDLDIPLNSDPNITSTSTFTTKTSFTSSSITESLSTTAAAAVSNETLPSDLHSSNDDSLGTILPDHYFEPNGIPVFRPTWNQFHDFHSFLTRIEEFGYKAGLVKVIPPPEWTESLPDLTERLSHIFIKRPIVQHISGGQGIFTQANIEARKQYSVQAWFEHANSPDHSPPETSSVKRQNAQIHLRKRRKSKANSVESNEKESSPNTVIVTNTLDSFKSIPKNVETENLRNPKTSEIHLHPSSNRNELSITSGNLNNNVQNLVQKSYSSGHKMSISHLVSPTNDFIPSLIPQYEKSVTTINPAQSSPDPPANQKHKRRRSRQKTPVPLEFNLSDLPLYSDEQVSDLERQYWRNLTYSPPWYGADMPGSLLKDSEGGTWNLSKLKSLLKSVTKKLPGVNTPYLYFGMWKVKPENKYSIFHSAESLCLLFNNRNV